jgi:Ser/Thr protein kinase RdoA (MazF antagonist)
MRRLRATETLPDAQARVTQEWSQQELGRNLSELVAWLRDWAGHLQKGLETASWLLPNGPIHADAHTGNLLLPRDDTSAVLCDLDAFCNGPREWDLVPTAHGAARFGRSLSEYHAFTDVYGLDITTWVDWPLLRDIRELELVTSVLPTLAGRQAVARELAHRLRSLQSGDIDIVWQRCS